MYFEVRAVHLSGSGASGCGVFVLFVLRLDNALSLQLPRPLPRPLPRAGAAGAVGAVAVALACEQSADIEDSAEQVVTSRTRHSLLFWPRYVSIYRRLDSAWYHFFSRFSLRFFALCAFVHLWRGAIFVHLCPFGPLAGGQRWTKIDKAGRGLNAG